jgi:hypothetical protein
MSKKAVFLLSLVAVAASLLSYKLGSARVAYAGPTPQEVTDQVPLSLPAPPAEWVVTNSACCTTEATVTRGGVAGVQHVADCVSFAAYAQASSGSGGDVQLLDGSTVLMEWSSNLPSVVNGHGGVSVCGLNVVGGVGKSMTLKYVGNAATGSESVNLVGHDAT